MKEQFRLRIAEEEDMPFLYTLFNNPDITDYWFMEPYASTKQIKEELLKDDESRVFIVVDDEDRKVGLVALFAIEQRHRHAEFAIAFAPEHQGKGYAKKVIKLALDYAFFTLNLYKVYLIVVAMNEKAWGLYEKVGFQNEGRLKRHYYINGTYYDGIVMSMFYDEYRNKS